MKQEIKKKIKELSDQKYHDFHSSLCPGTENIIGVRVPVLRNYAKELFNSKDWKQTIKEIDNEYYEEIMLQGMLIGQAKNEDIDTILKYIEEIYNFIDGYDQMTKVNNDKGWVLAYHNLIREYEKEKMEHDSSSPMTYSLVYLNDDEIPELVVGNTGFWVSVYTWYYGNTVAIIEGWSYGAFGIGGYFYLPREGIVSFTDADFAGYIRYCYFLQMNEKLELTNCNDKSLSIWLFRDEDEDYHIDEGEEVEEPIFYYGDMEISEEEFQEHYIEGDYEMLMGEKCAQEILDEMMALVEE